MPIVSLTELCRRPGVPSLPTLRKIIDRHPDFPIIARGHKGERWKIDAEAAEAFLRSLDAPTPADLERRRRFIEQLGLTIDPNAVGHVR
ncbi:MAG: hypothetical protein KA533_07160 [Sphingobium sp.]|nr:hypothetical protein [Sphingobium sp.]MBP6111758.1 hypothetical protein [Sphingobium sp.]MBP8671305.1 hypothetical protein [Sphingobium sp.]MBP9158344.1 hypothetical protein [Sphingobium sp.]MCC6482063.1 hypothetical protein [Sphingomonadaceae bacterium]